MPSSIGPIGNPSGYNPLPTGGPAQQVAQAMGDILNRISDMQRNPENEQSDWALVLQDIQTLQNAENNKLQPLTAVQRGIVNQITDYFGSPFPTDPSHISAGKMAQFLKFINGNIDKFR